MDPIRIPLSQYQVARFTVMQADKARVEARINDAITTIVAGTLNPDSLQGWVIDLTNDAIVCTPPAQADAG